MRRLIISFRLLRPWHAMASRLTSGKKESSMKKQMMVMGWLLLFAMDTFSQLPVQTLFSYDEAGNRVEREVSFSPIGEGLAGEQETLTSVSDSFGAMCVSIYPNPTNDKVFVATSNNDSRQTMKATLMSAAGQLLEEKSVKDAEESFDLSGRASGIYLIELSVGTEKHVWKLIRQ